MECFPFVVHRRSPRHGTVMSRLQRDACSSACTVPTPAIAPKLRRHGPRKGAAVPSLHLRGAFFVLHLVCWAVVTSATRLEKVIVPAVYKEWWEKAPPWAYDESMKKTYGYDVFLTQKFNSSTPNYVRSNRGCENAVYYQYIVENYDTLPDHITFIHGFPSEHSNNWLDMVRCASGNLTYFNLNLKQGHKCRKSWNGIWAKDGIWIEQCIRNTLRIAWGNLSMAELNRRLPPDKPIMMCAYCCQQFIISRETVKRRSLAEWKHLQDILSTQNVCHVGEPDYDNLYAFNASSRMRVGPEDPLLGTSGKGRYGNSLGRVTQAVVSEHLAHVIFGDLPLEQHELTQRDICNMFIPQSVCPGSPCAQ